AARETPYFEPRYPRGDVDRFSGSIEDASVALREALERATALRMLRADVPVGSYLSGGLDSSVIAALAKRAKPSGFTTFSLRFADPEYDETSYQRAMVERLGTDHAEIVVGTRDIAEVFPKVIWHTERPLLRSGPAPLYLLSQLVRERGIKVVLTGEGADEVLAGYDLFREGKVRRFWARRPHSTWRPRLLERLYPYLTRSPVAQQATARQFFGRGLELAREPGFAHHPRWSSAAALKRLFSSAQREAVGRHDVVAELLADLPDAFSAWSHLAQDQYLEVRTLLSGYLLSSQGDRMLMASSVEGRFPFLDKDVMALANSFPDSYKLAVLDEKHVLKAAARELVPDSIRERPKQPYRAPDAMAFVGAGRPKWVDELMSASAIEAAGVFDAKAVGQLWSKALQRGDASQFSNADNMAIVAVLSTQILHRDFVAHRREGPDVSIKTDIDRVAEAA
ncbi:MAG TPA: asparagine synthase C-terminal domain-containing protein, partial [Myxococcota bacterium]|nr:asparagine synthase C-terminal domain-containing protein [Myxococcota bacterium]